MTPKFFPQTRARGELLFCVALIIMSVALLSQIGGQTTWLAGKKLASQPRLWPALSLGGVVLFASLNWSFRRQITHTPGRWAEAALWVRSLEFIAYYMMYVWAIPQLGYLPATLVFCALLTIRLGYRGRTIIYAVLFGLVVVLFFKTAMNVKIPGGALYDLAPDGLRYVLHRYF